jgi:hypothetical protein
MEDVWVKRIQAAGILVDQLMRYLGPLLTGVVLYLQAQTRDEVKEVKTEATAQAKVAASTASVAAKSASAAAENAEIAVKTLGESRDERAEQIARLEKELQEAKLLNELQLKHWKAYNTKSPEDMEEASRMTEAVLERSAASAAPPK